MRGLRCARLLAGVFLLAGLLASCAHRVPLPEASTARIPQRMELVETPFFPQERYQCGPAALATMLNVRGVKAVPDALVSQVYLPAREGSLQVEMVAAVRRQGLLAIAVEPALDALLIEIAAGQPVLVLQNLGLDWLPRWHYAVAIGYDLGRQELILRSGTEPRRATPFGVFMKTWDRSSRWGIVVLDPGSLPPHVKPVPWLEAASALEAVGRWQQAQAAYRAATRKWPDNPVVWIGLGNASHARGDAESAERAFRHALRVRPDSAVAWNNLAYVLADRQCVRSARAAARCAGRLAPGHAGIRQTLEDMSRVPAAGKETCEALPACPAH